MAFLFPPNTLPLPIEKNHRSNLTSSKGHSQHCFLLPDFLVLGLDPIPVNNLIGLKHQIPAGVVGRKMYAGSEMFAV
jgi:hypothetical protein